MLTIENRPRRFEDVIGQPGVVKELKRHSLDSSFPNVMFFEGASGSGKTTMAMLVAACIHGPEDDGSKGHRNPNLDAEEVKAIYKETFHLETSFYDASNMSKDDVLALGETLNSGPLYSDERVVIVDEAQELSKAGRGAALRLLERRRPDTYIILCTMDVSKLDNALQDRGRVYKFRPLKPEDIARALFEQLKVQTVVDLKEIPQDFVDVGIFTLAENVHGSLRSALQYFERCLYGGFFTEQDILEEFGFLSVDKATTLVMDILNGNLSKPIFQHIEEVGTKEFFHKTWRILADAAVYAVQGQLKPKWKEQAAKKIAGNHHEQLKELLDVYEAIGRFPYFREEVFINHLAMFVWNRNSVPDLKPKRQPVEE